MAKLPQIILRIDDEFGHHIIRHHTTGWPYSLEGYHSKPDNYQKPPNYFMPIDKEQVKQEFEKQGKEWKFD